MLRRSWLPSRSKPRHVEPHPKWLTVLGLPPILGLFRSSTSTVSTPHEHVSHLPLPSAIQAHTLPYAHQRTLKSVIPPATKTSPHLFQSSTCPQQCVRLRSVRPCAYRWVANVAKHLQTTPRTPTTPSRQPYSQPPLRLACVLHRTAFTPSRSLSQVGYASSPGHPSLRVFDGHIVGLARTNMGTAYWSTSLIRYATGDRTRHEPPITA
ncbi:hypothetical protein BDW22DRAFT_663585 [Trametopsis cervina]|nr:hypothetical protein BDW22DRAFT_663585 [Trametopsis cervina]